MNTLIITITLLSIYILFMFLTYRVCRSGAVIMDEYDRILMPLISIFWPLAWSFIIGNEIVGVIKRKISAYKRAKRIKKKAKHHLHRLKEMNQ